MIITDRTLRQAVCTAQAAMALLFLTLGGTSASGTSARTITAVRADAAPRIDGLPDDACWAGAAKVSNFQACRGPAMPPEEPACIALAWDKDCLYLYFTCCDHRMAALHATETKRDGAVWKDDDIELFLAEEGKTGYYQFAVNTLNTRFDARDAGDGKLATSWNSGMRSAVTLHSDRWQGEIAVPWRDIGIAPSSGGTLKVNVGRGKLGKPDFPAEVTCLFKSADGRLNDTSAFGNLVLGNMLSAPYFTLENQAELAKDRSVKSVSIRLASSGGSFQTVRAEILSDGEPVFAGAVQARAAGTEARAVEIPFTSQARGRQEIRLTLSDAETGQIIAGNDYGMASRYGGTHKARYISRKEGYQLWHTGSTQKILPGDEIESQGEGRDIDISLAKNEYEPFQLVITPSKGKSLTGLTLSFTDLKGESATLGKENITWNLEGYIDIKKASLNRDAVAGLWPDPLLKGSGFNITEDRHYPMWVTVYAPPNTPAGLYSGTARLQQNGRDMESFNLRVRVWDFSLPDISNLTGIAGVWFYGKLSRNMPFADMLKNVKSHKFASTGRVGAGMSEDEYFNVYGMRHGDFPGFSGAGGWNSRRALFGGLRIEPKDPEYRRKFIEWARELWNSREAQGYAGKLTYSLWDEPFLATDADLRENLPLYAKLIREALPKIDIALTDYNLEEPTLRDMVDTWIYPLHFGAPYNRAIGDKVRSRGKRVMAYHNNLYLIDLPAVNARIYPWMLRKYGFDGFLIWGINSWTGSTSKYDPWKADYPGRNGDGCLVYPEKDFTGVLDSIRWELLRDGLEDYDYICLVESAVKSGRLAPAEQEKGRALIKEAESLVAGFNEFTRDPERIYSMRRRMGDFLSGLNSKAK